MQNHEQKNCPRCNKSFVCKAGNITQCQCYGFDLKPDLKVLLEQRYNECLCVDCLRHLQQDISRFKERFFNNTGK